MEGTQGIPNLVRKTGQKTREELTPLLRGVRFAAEALLEVGVGGQLGGQDLDYFPAHAADQAAVEPVYEEMEGWKGQTTAGARSWADLPAQAIKYVQRVQELIETPVALVSTSPERQDTILVRDPFAD